MPVHITEYHPYAACLMFKACRSSKTVRENLDAVQEHSHSSLLASHERLKQAEEKVGELVLNLRQAYEDMLTALSVRTGISKADPFMGIMIDKDRAALDYQDADRRKDTAIASIRTALSTAHLVNNG